VCARYPGGIIQTGRGATSMLIILRCLWHCLVHTATQLNRLSTDLLATDSRVRSPLTTILVCLLLLLSSEKKKLWLSLLIGCRHKHDVCFVTCQQEGACASSAAQRITTVVVTVVVVIGSSTSRCPYYCTTNSHIIRNLQTTIFAEGLPSQHRPLASCLGIEH
jgi:hypothetical protein